VKRLALPLLATMFALAGCSSSSTSADSTVATSAPSNSASTLAPTATTASTVAPTDTVSGTQTALQLASVNGTTLAAVSLNEAMLQKAGWTAKAATTESTTPVVAKRSTREAQILLSALQSSPPKGYTVTAFGSEGIVPVYNGVSIVAKALTGLVEYIEVSSKGASVCLRPSIDGNKDTSQIAVTNDGYRNLPVGRLVQPAGDDGWIILLRTATKAACRLSLDTLAAP